MVIIIMAEGSSMFLHKKKKHLKGRALTAQDTCTKQLCIIRFISVLDLAEVSVTSQTKSWN